MLVKNEGPKKAISWYAKTQFILFFSLLMFFVLFGVIDYLLIGVTMMNGGVAAIISVILSLALTFLFFRYYNKRHIKEWKEKNDNKQNKLTSQILPSLFLGLFILFVLITFIFESQTIKIIGRTSMIIIFLFYVYFKFFKK